MDLKLYRKISKICLKHRQLKNICLNYYTSLYCYVMYLNESYLCVCNWMASWHLYDMKAHMCMHRQSLLFSSSMFIYFSLHHPCLFSICILIPVETLHSTFPHMWLSCFVLILLLFHCYEFTCGHLNPANTQSVSLLSLLISCCSLVSLSLDTCFTNLFIQSCYIE